MKLADISEKSKEYLEATFEKPEINSKIKKY
jgi:hypothetical protein